MSFSFAAFLAAAESAFTTVVTDVAPIIPLAEQAGTVVSALVPGAAPTIAAIEAGAASIAAIAPTAISDVQSAIATGQKILADVTPEISSLEATFDKIFHITPTPQGLLVTAKTTSATAPAAAIAPPGNAVS